MPDVRKDVTPPPYVFGVSEFTTWPWTFEQDVRTYANLGVDTIEVCEFKLEGGVTERQLALVDELDLEISSVQPVLRTLFPSRSQPVPKDVKQRMGRFRQTIENFASSCKGVAFVTNTGMPPDGNIREVLEVAKVEYRELARYAEDHGVKVALEPLNPSIMNIESAIWTLEQGIGIVEAVDHPSFGICLDFWNVWQNAAVLETIKACGTRIFVVQVSDWRTPRSHQDRFIPGQGEIPMAALLEAVYAGGFRGAYAIEIFSGGVSDSLWDADLEGVIIDSRAGFDRAWREAFTY